MEKKPIPEWVNPKDYTEYRELELMTKETIIKKWWYDQSNELKSFKYACLFLLTTTLLFEILWLLASS